MHVAAQPVELADDNRPAGLARSLDGGGKLRPPVERVRALAALVFGEVADEPVALGLGERPDRLGLRFEAEPGLRLLVVETRM